VSATVGVVLFPGTNCELDVEHAVEQLGGSAKLLFHTERDLQGVDAVVVPGGFAHGD
jgi:phosphoribosylformylglycinamidine synthase subunit PurQ / glutaminase